jgi:hypothetical protein
MPTIVFGTTSRGASGCSAQRLSQESPLRRDLNLQSVLADRMYRTMWSSQVPDRDPAFLAFCLPNMGCNTETLASDRSLAVFARVDGDISRPLRTVPIPTRWYSSNFLTVLPRGFAR